jgi:hypothetical protein
MIATQPTLDLETPSDAGGGVAAVTVARPRSMAHDTPAILAAVMADPLPARQTDREVIEAAIVRAAAEHDGLVTAAWVRPHIGRDVMPQMVGAALRPRRGFLEVTDRHPVRNEGGSGNANKWSPVYRLVQH